MGPESKTWYKMETPLGIAAFRLLLLITKKNLSIGAVDHRSLDGVITYILSYRRARGAIDRVMDTRIDP